MQFDVGEIIREVEAASESLQGTWLKESWEHPDDFTQALVQHQVSAFAVASKSRVGHGVDLGHEVLLRHLPSERPALLTHDRRFGWQALTYNDLERRSALRARSWLAQGVVPGDVVALVYPIGAELAISLLAALRIGAVGALVNPSGKVHVKSSLARLAPIRIATEPLNLPLLGESSGLFLSSDGQGLTPLLRSASFTYPSDKPVLVTCAPVDPEDAPVVGVPSEVAWRGALRDAILTFGLRSGENMAAPGFDIEQHQPALLLAAWLNGATFVHIETEDLHRDPTLLSAHPLRVLGVSVEARDILLRSGTPPARPWGLWFRNPEEPFEYEAWRRFIQKLELKAVAHSNIVIDAACGGAVLSSHRFRGRVSSDVLPAPGRSWKLIDPMKAGAAGVPADAHGASALGGAGVFVCDEEGERTGYLMLTQTSSGFLYAGTLRPRRSGRVFPAEAVSRVVDDLPFVRGAFVVPAPVAGVLHRNNFILVVLTGDEEAERTAQLAGERIDALRRKIVVDLGPDALPDRVEFFPVYPREEDGELNEEWCRRQYFSGGLHWKSRDPAFRLLTRLRGLTESEGP